MLNNLNYATQFFKFNFNDFEIQNNVQNITNFQEFNLNNKKNYIAKNSSIAGSFKHAINQTPELKNNTNFFEIENSYVNNDENLENKPNSNYNFYHKKNFKNLSYYNNQKTIYENSSYYNNQNSNLITSNYSKYQENQDTSDNNHLKSKIYNNNGRFNDKFISYGDNQINKNNKNYYNNFNNAKKFSNYNYRKTQYCNFPKKNYHNNNRKFNYENNTISNNPFYKNNPKSAHYTKNSETPYDTYDKRNAEITNINEEIKNNNSIDMQEQKKIDEIQENDYLKKNYKELLNLNQLHKGLTEEVKNQPYPKFFIIKSFNEEDFHKVNI